MRRHRIFISSVQSEFSHERKELHDYILSDALLGKFFDPFLFEMLPATDQRADHIYLREVDRCDIYLGILGKEYGSEDEEGISPTEREFDHATELRRTRLIFLSSHPDNERTERQRALVGKVQSVLIRRRFNSTHELKAAVYAALVRYLEERDIIRSTPFDATLHPVPGVDGIDERKVARFVGIARSRRGFPLTETSPLEEVLTHMNLMDDGRMTQAAILLFGKDPQRYFINSEVRCAAFHGTIIEKPIPSYKVFKGDVFELVDQSVEFILSRLDYSVGTRARDISIPGRYEIPKEIIAEAMVNAVAHRDYTGKASVQVMVFSDRVEIWNPGSLPMGWTVERLKQWHGSVPANPLLAEPMYLMGYIERFGTGTSDMVRLAAEHGLREPDFVQDDVFKVILYRPSQPRPDDFGGVPGEFRGSSGGVPGEVVRLVLAMAGEMSRAEIQAAVGLRHDDNFRTQYVQPALKLNFIEMTFPQRPNHPKQRYRLTRSGQQLKAGHEKRE